ncbi:MAG: 1,4-alpha-glucan branching enzyme, partial [Gammaproteobacteria bacterium]
MPRRSDNSAPAGVDDATAYFLDELAGARCAVPFQFLGLHPGAEGKGLVLRVWMPDADRVEVIDLREGRNLGPMERRGETDLFVLRLARRRRIFPYELRVCRKGREFAVQDPYQYRKAVFARGPEDRNRLYRYLGAHPEVLEGEAGGETSGVRFAVYAPAARSVSVVGPFNDWDGRRHPMQSSYEGVWRLFVPGLEPGALYKFELKGPDGQQLPAKADPFGFYSEQPPGNASIVMDPMAYNWQDEGWVAARREGGYRADRPMSIYEVHAGSWRRA